MQPLRLKIRPIITFVLRFGPLIILQVGPFKTIYDLVDRTRYFPGFICVLDPENKFTFVHFGKEVIIQSSSETTNVEISSRRRSKSDSYFILRLSYIFLIFLS